MTVLLGISALIHLLPVSGVLGVERLEALYGVSIDDPTTELAMRHRAVLFGVLGGLLLASIWRQELRLAVLVATGVADLSFLVLAWMVPDTHPAMGKVIAADVVSLLCVAGALFLL